MALREESTAFTWFLTSRTRSRSVAYCTSQLGNQRRQVPSRQCRIFSFGPAFDAQHKATSHNTSKITLRHVALRCVMSCSSSLSLSRERRIESSAPESLRHLLHLALSHEGDKSQSLAIGCSDIRMMVRIEVAERPLHRH